MRAASSRVCELVMRLFISASTLSEPDSAPKKIMVAPERRSARRVRSE